MSVKDIYVGTHLPLIRDVSLIRLEETGELEIDLEFEYLGGFRLNFELVINVHLPGNVNFSLPATFQVTIRKLAGKVRMQCLPPPSNRLWIGFHSEPELELDIDTGIGVDSKIRNLPKLANIIVTKLQTEILAIMVLPHMEDFPIPIQKGNL